MRARKWRGIKGLRIGGVEDGPEHDDELRTTVPQGYDRLLEHISVHRWFRSIEESREVPWREAVASWRDRVYRPAVEAIEESGILDEFPKRTETDLYLFVMDHLAKLRERYGARRVSPRRAAYQLELSHRRQRTWPQRLHHWWHHLTH